ncbi:DUF433 domain-containing protein [Nonomuraea turkmeniaca]|uniref:DUF433 domain-containing protein n=1 Tax=Nonomuraea turkmeniaca TaxID=103838 RepID=A0A5S4F9V1_9ACTN|nr:DUF433 domain-containing protein [Nonomuraea turkmeniaca]TMR13795.1 DUF433 domain-containing protein [Nonomuraea turkmeniaca]
MIAMQKAADESVRRPRIVADPAVNFGKPTIEASGVSVAVIISAYLAGDRPQVLYDEYGISRGDLLICCWWVARYAKQKRAWRQWLNTWEPVLWRAQPGAYEQVPLPPRRPAHECGLCGCDRTPAPGTASSASGTVADVAQ